MSETAAPFIIGTGRCGSTLLRLMLDCHTDLAIPPESHFFVPALLAARIGDEPRKAFLDAVLDHERWHASQVDASSYRRAVDSLEPFDAGKAMRRFYTMYSRGRGKRRWGDKSPSFFNDVSLIAETLPEARFVHLIRDGRDVALSYARVSFGPGSVEEGAAWWAVNVSHTREQGRRLDRYIEVHFEDLVLDTERVLRVLCDYLDLEWDDGMLRYYETAEQRLKNPGGIHTLTRKPPQKDAVARWKRSLAPEVIARFESVAGKVLHDLGYETAVEESSLPEWWLARQRGLEELKEATKPGDLLAIADGGYWNVPVRYEGRWCMPFPEHRGIFNGVPGDEGEALTEFEKQRSAHPTHFAIAEPAAWWFDRWPGLRRRLEAAGSVVLESPNLKVYELAAV